MEIEAHPSDSPSAQRFTRPRTEDSGLIADTTESELGSFRPVTLEMIESLNSDLNATTTTTEPSHHSGTEANSSSAPTSRPLDVASRMIGTEPSSLCLTLLIIFAGRLGRIEPAPLANVSSGSTTGES
jgi:hypothetical protein